METITWYYLLAIGIGMIGIEALTLSFFLVWLGVGFVIVAGLTYLGAFDNGTAQLAASVSIGLVLVFLLRRWSMNMLSKTQDDREEKIHRSGIGTIDGGAIRMDGTYWQSDDDLSGFKDGDKVEVVDIINNKAVLAK